MSGGRGVRGNREVSPLFLLRGGGSGRIATTTTTTTTTPEATSKEGGSWGKHGFPHGSEPKARDAHARIDSSSSYASRVAGRPLAMTMFPKRSTCAEIPGGITVVESYWLTIAGPVSRFPAFSAERS